MTKKSKNKKTTYVRPHMRRNKKNKGRHFVKGHTRNLKRLKKIYADKYSGYEYCDRELDSRVDYTGDIDGLIEDLKALRLQYNAFSSEKAAEVIEAYKGGITMAEFGRGGSPELIVQADGRINEVELFKNMKESFKAKKMMPDEASVNEFGKIRFWWD